MQQYHELSINLRKILGIIEHEDVQITNKKISNVAETRKKENLWIKGVQTDKQLAVHKKKSSSISGAP